MTNIRGFRPPDVGADEHIVRRLGWALIRQWSILTPEQQDLLLKQAVFTLDRDDVDLLGHKLREFIAAHHDRAGDAHLAEDERLALDELTQKYPGPL